MTAMRRVRQMETPNEACIGHFLGYDKNQIAVHHYDKRNPCYGCKIDEKNVACPNYLPVHTWRFEVRNK